MNNEYINIAGVDYYTTREVIKKIGFDCGFKVNFKNYNLDGRFRKGYINAIFKGEFNNFLQKLKASKKVKEQLNKLVVV